MSVENIRDKLQRIYGPTQSSPTPLKILTQIHPPQDFPTLVQNYPPHPSDLAAKELDQTPEPWKEKVLVINEPLVK